VETPPERNDFPGKETRAGYGSGNEYDEAPLPGPWGRRPVETNEEWDDSPGDHKVDSETEQREEREVPTLRREDRDKGPVIQAQSFKIKNREPDDACTEQLIVPDSLTAALGEEKPFGNENDCPKPVHPRALMNRLFSPSGIYAGIIMAEVLGSRGGRNGRQSGVGRQNRRY